MRALVIGLCAAVSLSACVTPAEQIASYAPVVDPKGHSQAFYDQNLSDCRALGATAQASYQKQQNDALAASILIGVLAGAAIGAAYEDPGYGAAYGAVAGAAGADTGHAAGGPQRIIDRCMVSRGFTVLSDLGVGQ